MEKIRIAIADDHAVVRKGIVAMLSENEAYETVISVANGKELIQKISMLDELPQVCLLDISMPVMDGYTALVEIKRHYPEIQVLILSQYDEELAIIKMLKGGASGFLHKDSDPSEVVAAIKAILNGSYYQNDIVNGRIVNLVRRESNEGVVILSDTEIEFLKFVCSELTYKEIADRMSLSKRTVEGYRERLFEKLEVKSRTALAMYALRLGIVPYNC